MPANILCFECGNEHPPNRKKDKLTYEQKVWKYRHGEARFPAPEDSLFWDTNRWVQWIDAHGQWS